MILASALRLAVFAVIVGGGLTLSARAEDAAALPAAAAPANAPQNPLPGSAPAQTAAPDPAKDPQSCLQETGDYVTHGNTVTYLIGVTNICDKRLKCVVDAYVVGAKGPASGHTTVVLSAKSSGAAATKTYAMKVKSAGGTAQVSRDCKVF